MKFIQITIAFLLLVNINIIAGDYPKPVKKYNPNQYNTLINPPLKSNFFNSASPERIIGWSIGNPAIPLDSTWCKYDNPYESWLKTDTRYSSVDTIYKISNDNADNQLYRTILLYDSSNYLLESRTEMFFDSLGWLYPYRSNFTYDTNHNITLQVDSAPPVIDMITIKTYSTTNKLLKAITNTYSSGAVYQTDSTVYDYDLLDSLVLKSQFRENVTNGAIMSIVDSVNYNSSHQIIHKSNYIIFYPNSPITSTSFATNDYVYLNNNPVRTVYLYTSSSYTQYKRDSLFYTGNQLDSTWTMGIDNNNWNGHEKTIYTYQNNLLVDKSRYVEIDTINGLQIFDRENFYYSNYGNLILYTTAYLTSVGLVSGGYDRYYYEDCAIATNLKTVNNSSLKLYPNPTQNKFIVQNSANHQVVVTDILGNKLYDNKAVQNNLEIDLSNFANGTYFVKVGTNVSKVIKE